MATGATRWTGRHVRHRRSEGRERMRHGRARRHHPAASGSRHRGSSSLRCDGGASSPYSEHWSIASEKQRTGAMTMAREEAKGPPAPAYWPSYRLGPAGARGVGRGRGVCGPVCPVGATGVVRTSVARRSATCNGLRAAPELAAIVHARDRWFLRPILCLVRWCRALPRRDESNPPTRETRAPNLWRWVIE
jgi:hypothetical protein